MVDFRTLTAYAKCYSANKRMLFFNLRLALMETTVVYLVHDCLLI